MRALEEQFYDELRAPVRRFLWSSAFIALSLFLGVFALVMAVMR